MNKKIIIKFKDFNPENANQLSKMIGDLVDNKKTFWITGLNKAVFKDVIIFVEKIIEDKKLSCRVYTAGRAIATLGVAGMAVIPGVNVAAAIVAATAAASVSATHNVITDKPDYEIAKYHIRKKLKVSYCKVS